MITLTDVAKSKIIEIAESEEIGYTSVRVKIKGGGCAGIVHDIYFDNEITDLDEVFTFDDVTLIIDQISFQYLEKVTIDYLDSPFSGGFKFSSPDITGSCGCGHSYSY